MMQSFPQLWSTSSTCVNHSVSISYASVRLQKHPHCKSGFGRPTCLQSGIPPSRRNFSSLAVSEDVSEGTPPSDKNDHALRSHFHPIHGLAAHHGGPQDRVDVVVESSRHIHFSGQATQSQLCPLAAYRAHYIGYPTDHDSGLELYDAYVLHGPCRLERRGDTIKAHMFAGAALDLYESELGKILHLTAEQLQHVFRTKDLPHNTPDQEKQHTGGPNRAASDEVQPVGGNQCSCKHADHGDMGGTSSRCLCEAELVGESYALQGEGIIVSRAGKGIVYHNNKLLLRAHSLDKDASILLPKGALLSHPLLMTPDTEMTWCIA